MSGIYIRISGYLGAGHWIPCLEKPRKRVSWLTGLEHEAQLIKGDLEPCGLLKDGIIFSAWRVKTLEYECSIDGEKFTAKKDDILTRSACAVEGTVTCPPPSGKWYHKR